MTGVGVVAAAVVESARERVAPHVHRTPVFTLRSLDAELGVSLVAKAELFQRSGSFKIRGVLNTLLSMQPDELARGVVSISAGNHAAALALGAAVVGTTAHIVMPAHASAAKVAATRAYGGEAVLTERPLREVMGELRDELGAAVVHPFDDPRIIAGAASVGLELAEQLPDVELVVVAVGGGGLISGVAAGLAARGHAARIVGVEPEGADAMTRALAAGAPVTLEHPASLADGLTAPFAGAHTLAHVRALVDEVVTVTDHDIARATWLLHQRSKLLAEPAGATALAGLLAGVVKPERGSRVAIVVSGGNVDAATLRRVLDLVAT